MSYRILSLDVSGSSTGWSFATKNSKKLLFGTIKTDPSDPLAKRLDMFRRSLWVIMATYRPNIILLEDTFVGKNPAVNKLLSKFGGVAEQSVYEYTGTPPVVISNKTVKAFFHVKKKEALFEVMHDLLDWTAEHQFKGFNDIADSIAQLKYYLDLKNLSKVREEVEYGFKYK